MLVGEVDEISGEMEGLGGVEADPQGQLFWEGGAGNQHSASHLQGGEKKVHLSYWVSKRAGVPPPRRGN